MDSSIINLPVELLEAIIDHIPSKKDRRSLWAVSRIFRKLLASRVFETLTIRTNEQALPRLDERPYTSLDATHPLDCLKLVKHLHLRAPFHEKLGSDRCPHTELYGRLPKDPFTGRQPYGNVARLLKLIPLLLQLEENGLVSFSWDLGMCIPEHILGREGYLTKKQTAIESLSLITGAHHPRHEDSPAVQTLVLSSFPRIRKFSWKGLRLTEELESLRGFFASNYQILEDLELDFIDWDLVNIKGVSPRLWGKSFPSFTKIILPQVGKDVRTFASLKRLALSEFGFEDMTHGITQAFNVSHLQTLKLHNCPGILTFLSTIVDAGLALKLKSLEFIIHDNAVEYDGGLESPLISFLQSFDGLEDLYLMLRAEMLRPEHWPSCYWNAILHHSSTLKRLIYHERTTTYVEQNLGYMGSRWREEWADNLLYRLPLGASDDEVINSYDNHLYNRALPQMGLECFGVADDPNTLQAIMGTPSAVEQNFKLLHIRRTATDTEWNAISFEGQICALFKHNPRSWSRSDYLQWVAEGQYRVFKTALSIFQSPKLNNLQVLAFGDFSHGNRYKGRNLLLCRAVTPNPEVKFRVMSPSDTAFYMRAGVLSLDFLAACPRNALLGNTKWKFP